jgi:hypothetical protein
LWQARLHDDEPPTLVLASVTEQNGDDVPDRDLHRPDKQIEDEEQQDDRAQSDAVFYTFIHSTVKGR